MLSGGSMGRRNDEMSLRFPTDHAQQLVQLLRQVMRSQARRAQAQCPSFVRFRGVQVAGHGVVGGHTGCKIAHICKARPCGPGLCWAGARRSGWSVCPTALGFDVRSRGTVPRGWFGSRVGSAGRD